MKNIIEKNLCGQHELWISINRKHITNQISDACEIELHICRRSALFPTSERLIVSRSSFSLPLSQGPIQQGKFVSSCALACLIGRSSFMSPCLWLSLNYRHVGWAAVPAGRSRLLSLMGSTAGKVRQSALLMHSPCLIIYTVYQETF